MPTSRSVHLEKFNQDFSRSSFGERTREHQTPPRSDRFICTWDVKNNLRAVYSPSNFVLYMIVSVSYFVYSSTRKSSTERSTCLMTQIDRGEIKRIRN